MYTENGEAVDGEVLICKRKIGKVSHFYSIYVDIVASIAKYEYFDNNKMKDYIDGKHVIKYINEQGIHLNSDNSVDKVKEEISKKIIEVVEGNLFVFPKELSERQKRQQGVFALFMNKVGGSKGLNLRLEMEELKPDYTIKIDGNSKENILEKLSFYGITEDFLFPDNMDAVCKTITNKVKG